MKKIFLSIFTILMLFDSSYARIGLYRRAGDFILTSGQSIGVTPAYGWTFTGSSIYTTSAKVGIGTSTPLAGLDTRTGANIRGRATYVLTGSIDPAASTSVTGVNTLFLTELKKGDQITVSGETRTVATITSNTALTVTSAFSNNANDTAVDVLPSIYSFMDYSGVLYGWIDYTGAMNIYAASPAANATMFKVDGSSGYTTTIDEDGDLGFKGGSIINGAFAISSVAATGAITSQTTYGNLTSNAVSVVAQASTFAITKNNIVLTGAAAGDTISTITGGSAIGLYVIKCVDNLVMFEDNDTHAANTLDLVEADLSGNVLNSAADMILQLWWDGTSWYQAAPKAVN